MKCKQAVQGFWLPLNKIKIIILKVFRSQNKENTVLEKKGKDPLFLRLLVAQGNCTRIYNADISQFTVDINIQHTVLCSRNEMGLSVNEEKPIRKP